jgi:hypothetical protein
MAGTWENKWSHHLLSAILYIHNDLWHPGSHQLFVLSLVSRQHPSHAQIPFSTQIEIMFLQQHADVSNSIDAAQKHNPQVQSYLLPRAPLRALALQVDDAHPGVEPRCPKE